MQPASTYTIIEGVFVVACCFTTEIFTIVAQQTRRDFKILQWECIPSRSLSLCVMQDKSDGNALAAESPLAPTSPSASPRAPVSPQTPAIGKSAGGFDPNSNMTPSTEDTPSAHSELARLLRSNSKNHYTATKRDVSTGPLLRSLELRFQLESELVHVVDKFKNLNSRHTAEEFSRKIYELETVKLNVYTLKVCEDSSIGEE